MAIIKSVGRKGVNQSVDVKLIQAALNQVAVPEFTLPKKLVVDGEIGPKTNQCISEFQKDVVRLPKPDGRFDPGGKTLAALKKIIKKGISLDALLSIMAYGTKANIEKFLPLLRSQLPIYQINSPLRIAHFFAQVGHESYSFQYTEELASGQAYEGRKDLGNTQKGDGVRFKGRGLIQLTGRANYEKYAEYACVLLLNKPNEKLVATSPWYALDASLWFWSKRKLNRYADSDDLRSITRRVNGGFNGLADREAYLARAKFFLLT